MRFFYYSAFVFCSLLLADAAQAFPWPAFIPTITNMGNRQCSPQKHPNQIKVEKMAGSWKFTYNYHWDRADYYYFDINKVSIFPDPQMPNTYMIAGVNENGHEVSALYSDITIPYYPFHAHYSIIDNSAMNTTGDPYQTGGLNKYFLFDLVNNSEITGTFRDRVDPDWRIHYYPLKGSRIQ